MGSSKGGVENYLNTRFLEQHIDISEQFYNAVLNGNRQAAETIIKNHLISVFPELKDSISFCKWSIENFIDQEIEGRKDISTDAVNTIYGDLIDKKLR